MKIGQFIEYKGYVGSIEYDSKNNIYYGGLLNIRDFVDYKANNVEELYRHYHESVDDYIEFIKELEEGSKNKST